MITNTSTVQLLGRLQNGDEQSRSRLIARACDRLHGLASWMLKRYPGVSRWEQTDDLMQKALIRLNRALFKVPLASSEHFWHVATLQIKRALLDLAEHYKSARSPGTKHHTDQVGKADDSGGAVVSCPGSAVEPDSLETWTELHRAIDALPKRERTVVRLLWYGGLSQKEAAAELELSLRTLKRRWASARLSLFRLLGGVMPSVD
jgi:RNA polymerase sigma-70 factor (ECF subfamily)